MLSLDVYRYIASLLEKRGDFGRSDDARVPIKSFGGSDFAIHVLCTHSECQQVLADPTFIQPKISRVIASVISGNSGLSALQIFLANNPIELDGDAHRVARQKFVQKYKVAQRDIESSLDEIADQAFDYFIANGSSSILSHLAIRYVDDVIALIISRSCCTEVNPERWSGTAAPIFEFFHAANKLKDKEQQMSGFLKSLTCGSELDDATGISILLSYVLQGRDPLLGAITAYMIWLSSLTEEERTESIAQISARDLFWGTSPVNYIGRTATRDAFISDILVKERDQLILMLPLANHSDEATSRSSMAFGAGVHVCAGQAMALSIAAAWLAGLKERMRDIDWGARKSETVIPAVFRQYRGRS